MNAPVSPANLAELAVEVRLAERRVALAELSFALWLESRHAGSCRADVEQIAARIGLSREATRLVLNEWAQRARLLDEAHLLLKALIPHEAQVRELAARAG